MNAHIKTFPISRAVVQSVPVRCLAEMRPQPVEVWTPFSLIGAAIMALLFLPRQAALMPAAIRARDNRHA